MKKIKDVWFYIQGNVRYKIYYKKIASNKITSFFFSWFLSKHVKEQIDVRIVSMDKECYEKGECKICKCATTHLQMANKACDKPCYPAMLNKKEWEDCKREGFYRDGDFCWVLSKNKNEKYYFWLLNNVL